MWLRRNIFQVFFFVVMFSLSGCGFQPMYGHAATQAQDASALQGNVIIAPIDSGRFGQVLKTSLEDRFNPQGLENTKPDYTLQVSLTRSVTPSIVRSDGTILRYSIRFDTRFALQHNNKKAAAFTGTILRTSSYNVVPNANFATYEAEDNLNERLLKEIAEDYVLRISGYLAGKQ